MGVLSICADPEHSHAQQIRGNSSLLAGNNIRVLPNPVCTSTRAVPSASGPIQVQPPGLRSHRKCGRTPLARIRFTMGQRFGSDNGKQIATVSIKTDARRRREGVTIPIKVCPVGFRSCPSVAQVCPDCGHLFLADERDEPQRRHPAAGCRTFEQLLQRQQELAYKPGKAKHVWAARQRST